MSRPSNRADIRLRGTPAENFAARTERILAAVQRADPNLSQATVLAALDQVAPNPFGRAILALDLTLRPEVLTSGDPDSKSSTQRLIDLLVDAGSAVIARPHCTLCRRIRPLEMRLASGGRACNRCTRLLRSEPCSTCRRWRYVQHRLADGSSLCADCAAAEVSRWEDCTGCGRRQMIVARSPAGRWCQACHQNPRQPCSRCGRPRPVHSRLGGGAVCSTCAHQPHRVCATCGLPRAHGTTVDACARCGSPDIQRCEACGDDCFRFRIGGVGCYRCHLQRRVDQRVQEADPKRVEQLQGLLTALRTTYQTTTGLEWLSNNKEGRRLFTAMLGGDSPVSHDTLDDAAGRRLGRAMSVEYLRKLLVDAGDLPARNEELSRLERSIAFRLDDCPRQDVAILRQYATWVLLANARRRMAAGRANAAIARNARCSLTTAEAFLAEMRQQQVPVGQITQGTVESWLVARPHQRNTLAKFLGWTGRQRWTPTIQLPAVPPRSPRSFNPADRQFALARELLHNDEIDAQDRLAGCLILLYGQTPTRICRLTAAGVATADGKTTLRLGTTALLLPEPLDAIARELAAQLIRDLPGAGVATGLAVQDMWLYPGRPPTRPLSPAALIRRLERLGLAGTGRGAKAARNTALITLARDVPAAVLADLLGLDRGTAERWRVAAGGHWAGYAGLSRSSNMRSTTRAGEARTGITGQPARVGPRGRLSRAPGPA